MQIATVGLDLAKHIFQVHAVDPAGQVAVRKRLRRTEVLSFFASVPPCLIGMEACATSHPWARELTGLGHTVKLMPPAYVKAYVKRGKTDTADAEAICEAVVRPSMRFVPVKSAEQQSVLMLHRGRALLIRQRTMLVNALRHRRYSLRPDEFSGGHSLGQQPAVQETSPTSLCGSGQQDGSEHLGTAGQRRDLSNCRGGCRLRVAMR
jgi:transposase